MVMIVFACLESSNHLSEREDGGDGDGEGEGGGDLLTFQEHSQSMMWTNNYDPALGGLTPPKECMSIVYILKQKSLRIKSSSK